MVMVTKSKLILISSLHRASSFESQSVIESNIGKDLTTILGCFEHQKAQEELTTESILIGKYECENVTKHMNQNYEKLTYFESEKTLAWILGMRSSMLQKASKLQTDEKTCRKLLNSIILRGGLQTQITNPFDEEKFEARSSGSTAGSTPTADVVNLLSEPAHATHCSPMQQRLQSFIFGLAEGRTSDSTVW